MLNSLLSSFWHNILFFFIVERKIVFVLFFCVGSGSTYLYGHCDDNFHKNMTKGEGLEFVKKGRYFISNLSCLLYLQIFCVSVTF